LFEANEIFTTHQLIGKYLQLKTYINSTRDEDDQAFHQYLKSLHILKSHIHSIVRCISERVNILFPDRDFDGQDHKVGEDVGEN
jgi:hypothetical protein